MAQHDHRLILPFPFFFVFPFVLTHPLIFTSIKTPILFKHNSPAECKCKKENLCLERLSLPRGEELGGASP